MQNQLKKQFSENGRLLAMPVKEFREIINKDEIHIAIYCIDNNYFYAVNCKLGFFIRSSYPHPNTIPVESVYQARCKACEELKKWLTTNPAAKKRAKQFSILEYKQLELF